MKPHTTYGHARREKQILHADRGLGIVSLRMYDPTLMGILVELEETYIYHMYSKSIIFILQLWAPDNRLRRYIYIHVSERNMI